MEDLDIAYASRQAFNKFMHEQLRAATVATLREKFPEDKITATLIEAGYASVYEGIALLTIPKLGF